MPERNRNNGRTWLAALAAVVLLGGGWLWLSGAFAPWSFTKSVSVEPHGYFFRVKASYTHGDEPIEFEYVAVCGYRTTRYKDGDKSVDGTYAPKVMIKATSDGGALMIRTPRACSGQTTANRKAPADLLPFIIWFDDVNDLTFGWGYASAYAYDSPHAEVQFHGATIDAATAQDWKAWRAKAEAEYEPKGMLPGPWGYSYADSRPNKEPYDPDKRYIAKFCYGYIRLQLPEQARRQVREYWPSNRPRYWSPPPDKSGIYAFRRAADGKWRRIEYGHGRTASSFIVPPDQGEIGVPTRSGGGTIGVYGPHYPAEIFPFMPRSRSIKPVPTEPAVSYPRRIVETEEMNGFVACGGDAAIDHIESFDPLFVEKEHPVFINEELAVKDSHPLLRPDVIFEGDEYVLVGRWWGG